MNHEGYESYTLQELYEALETVDEVQHPGQTELIEKRIKQIEYPGRKDNLDLDGIKGWLILVGVGIIVSPIRIVYELMPVYEEVFENGLLEAFNDVGGDLYNPYLSFLMVAEMSINVCLISAWICVGYLFFTKKRAFPKWFIRIVLFNVVFVFADAIAVGFIVPGQEIFNAETKEALMRNIVFACIWIPYMYASKRVQVTFWEKNA